MVCGESSEIQWYVVKNGLTYALIAKAKKDIYKLSAKYCKHLYTLIS